MSFIMGDGDNVAFMRGGRRDFMDARLKKCEDEPKSCFPLLWTISPALLTIAPDWIRWYYNTQITTKNEFFVLPPSGDTYSYPSEMSGEDAQNFVMYTEDDCKLMATNASVSWEWFYHWGPAFKTYFPRYSENNIVQGFFCVNVPFNFPVV
jgi:hypothetical protein